MSEVMKFRVAVAVGIDGSAAAAATVKRDAETMAGAFAKAERGAKLIGEAAAMTAPKIQQQGAAARTAAAANDALETELSQAARQMGATGQSANTAARQVQQEGQAAQQAARAQDQLQSELNQTTMGFKSAGAGAQTFGERVRRAAQDARGGGGFDALIKQLGTLAAAYLSFQTAMKVAGDSVTAALDLSRLDRGFAAIAGGAQAGAREMEFVRGVADRLGLDLRKTADDYLKLAAAAKGTSLEGRQSRDVFVAISEASRVLGLDSMRTSMALNAVQQMISKGVASAEELSSQWGENMPGGFQLAARAMNMTTAELRKLAESGELTADVLLPRLAAELNKTYSAAAAAAGVDPSAQFARMQTAIFDAEAALGQAFIPALAEAASSFAAFVSSSDFLAFARNFGQGVSGIIQGLSYIGEALGVSGIRFREWRAAFALAAAQIIEIVGHLAAGINEKMAAAFGSLASGIATLGPALAAMLGVPQAAIAALSRGAADLSSKAAAEGAAIRRWSDDLAAGFRGVADEQIQLQTDSDTSAKRLKALAEQATAAATGLGKTTVGAGKAGDAAKKLAKQIEDLEKSYKDQTATAKRVVEQFGLVITSTLSAADKAKVLVEVGKKIAELHLDPAGAKALELERLALEAALAAKNLADVTKVIDLIPKTLEFKPIKWPEFKPPTARDMGWFDTYVEKIESRWREVARAMSGILQEGLTSAGVSAINEWKGLGDSFVQKLLTDLIKAFASAALKAAITAAFTNNGGGFWGNLVSAFTGSSGGGGGGGGGAGGWIGTLATAYRAWKGGGSFWGSLTGGGTTGGSLATTAANAPPYYLANPGTPYAAGTGGGSAGLGAGATALAVTAVGLAIVAAFKLYLDKREAKQFDDTGQRFYMGYGINPTAPVGHLPPVEPGSPHAGNIPQGGQNNGFDFLYNESSSGPIGRLNVPEIQTRGSLGNMIGADQVEALRKLVEENTLGLVDSLGGLVKGLGEFTLNIRNDGKEFMTTVDGVEQSFKTIDEAISAGIASMLDAGQFEGLSANIEAVLHNANEIGLDGLQAALDLAKQADAAISGSISSTAPAVTLFESQMKELEKQIKADTEQGLKWGISLESLNALGEKRIEQLKREQEAFAGQQVATVLEQLFALSPQAAADAELAMVYQRAVGAMRIAQLQMEADKLAALGYLTAAQMDRIQAYITALDAAGAGAAAVSGGGGGGEDPGVAQREARRAELWQILRDLENGGAKAVGSLAAALDNARKLGDEMRDLNMGEIYAQKMEQLATLAAGNEFMKPFEAIIAGADIGDAASKWEALKAKYTEAEAALLAGADKLRAAGFDVEAAMEKLRRANAIEAGKLGGDLLATFGDPFLKLREDSKDLADRFKLLDEMVAAGAVSAADAAEVHRWVAEQAFTGMVDSLLGIMDRYYSNVGIAEAARVQLAQAKFTLEMAQLQLQFELIKSMKILTAEQIAQIDGLFEYIRLHPPDFSKLVPPPPGGVGDPGTIGSGIDQAAANLERLMQMLRGWEDLALTPAERRLRDINEQYAQMLELAGRDQALVARVRAAYGLALKDFYTGLRAPLKDLLRDLGLGGGSTRTSRDQVMDLKAQYDALVQRLAANPNDAAALEQLNTVARALLQAASSYGQDGALYAGISASLQAMLPRILAGTPFDPRFAAGSGANDNGSTDRRGRANLPGTTRDPVIEQAKQDRLAQAQESAAILAVLKRIEAKIGNDPGGASDLADAVRGLQAAQRRKLA